MDQLETLDSLHAIAVEQSIVTPLSSMIVLVTTEQERLLDRLEAKGDRFQREVEEVGETLPESASLTGVNDWPNLSKKESVISASNSRGTISSRNGTNVATMAMRPACKLERAALPAASWVLLTPGCCCAALEHWLHVWRSTSATLSPWHAS